MDKIYIIIYIFAADTVQNENYVQRKRHLWHGHIYKLGSLRCKVSVEYNKFIYTQIGNVLTFTVIVKISNIITICRIASMRFVH